MRKSAIVILLLSIVCVFGAFATIDVSATHWTGDIHIYSVGVSTPTDSFLGKRAKAYVNVGCDSSLTWIVADFGGLIGNYRHSSVSYGIGLMGMLGVDITGNHGVLLTNGLQLSLGYIFDNGMEIMAKYGGCVQTEINLTGMHPFEVFVAHPLSVSFKVAVE